MDKLRLGGLASGMDTESIISKLTKPYQTKIDIAKQRQTLVSWRQEAYLKTNRDFSNFILDNKKELGLASVTYSGTVINKSYESLNWIMKGTSSNEEIATAITRAGTKPGVYDFNIKNIAKTATSVSNKSITKEGGNAANLVNQLGLESTDVIKFTIKTHKSQQSESFVGSQNALGSTKDKTEAISAMFNFTPDSGDMINFTIKTDQNIGGKTFSYDPSTTSLEDIIEDIDSAGLGVEAAYDAENDKFFIQRSDKGNDKWMELEDSSVLNGKAAGTTFLAGGISGSLMDTGAKTGEKIYGEVKGITFTYNDGGSDLDKISLSDIADDINGKDLGIKATYDETLDRFFFESEKTGEDNWFEIKDESYTNTPAFTTSTITVDNLESMGFSSLKDYNLTEYQNELKAHLEAGTDVNDASVDYSAMDETTLRSTLQAIIDDVNTDQATASLTLVQGYATDSNANELTIDMLKAAGVNNVYKGNLDEYKSAISAEASIADLAALQTVVDGQNTAEETAIYDELRAGTKDANTLTFEELEVMGISNLREYNLSHYRTTIAGLDLTNAATYPDNGTLKTAVQGQVTATNTAVETSSVNLINIYADADDASNISVDFLKSAGINNIYEGNLDAYKTAIEGASSTLSQADIQTLVDGVNDAEDTSTITNFRTNALMNEEELKRIHLFTGTDAHPDSFLKLGLKNEVKKTGVDATFDLNGAEDLKSATNEIDIQGFSLSVKDVGKTTIKISADVDKIVEKVSDFVDKYNELVDAVTKKLNEKKYKDYKPLSTEEKKAMSDDQVKLWEEKAKSGLLRSDSLLQRTLDKMRAGLCEKVEKYSQVELEDKIDAYTSKLKIEDSSITQDEIDEKVSEYRKTLQGYDQLTMAGISTEKYSKGSINNRLVIDEDKLRIALQDDPNSVIEMLFKSPSSKTDIKQGIFNEKYDEFKELNPEKSDTELREMANEYLNENVNVVNRQIEAQKRKESGIIPRLFDDITENIKEVVDEAGVGDDASLLRKIKTNILIDFVTKKASRSTLDLDIYEFDDRIKDINRTMQNVESRYYKQFANMEKELQKLNQQGAWVQQQMMGQQ